MTDEKIFYFVGVTTNQSKINQLFPLWMKVLGREDVVIRGIDHPLNHTPEAYRRSVDHIKTAPNVLGALVTAHKLNMLAASHDLFDFLDPLAEEIDEISCISKPYGKLFGFAKDPITAGKALHDIVGNGYFGKTGGEICCFGAGGAAVALLRYLMQQADSNDKPKQFTAVDILPERLNHMNIVSQKSHHGMVVNLVHSHSAAENDKILDSLPENSIVINATGLGKDRPGSPLTETAVFPKNGIVWEFNYRGERPFYQLALSQKDTQNLQIEDGWDYFIHGWSEVIAEVLDFDLTDALYQELKTVANTIRA
ncbi:MAG: shikimate dehydrogenase [Chloroflexota bacterium]